MNADKREFLDQGLKTLLTVLVTVLTFFAANIYAETKSLREDMIVVQIAQEVRNETLNRIHDKLDRIQTDVKELKDSRSN